MSNIARDTAIEIFAHITGSDPSLFREEKVVPVPDGAVTDLDEPLRAYERIVQILTSHALSKLLSFLQLLSRNVSSDSAASSRMKAAINRCLIRASVADIFVPRIGGLPSTMTKSEVSEVTRRSDVYRRLLSSCYDGRCDGNISSASDAEGRHIFGIVSSSLRPHRENRDLTAAEMAVLAVRALFCGGVATEGWVSVNALGLPPSVILELLRGFFVMPMKRLDGGNSVSAPEWPIGLAEATLENMVRLSEPSNSFDDVCTSSPLDDLVSQIEEIVRLRALGGAHTTSALGAAPYRSLHPWSHFLSSGLLAMAPLSMGGDCGGITMLRRYVDALNDQASSSLGVGNVAREDKASPELDPITSQEFSRQSQLRHRLGGWEIANRSALYSFAQATIAAEGEVSPPVAKLWPLQQTIYDCITACGGVFCGAEVTAPTLARFFAILGVTNLVPKSFPPPTQTDANARRFWDEDFLVFLFHYQSLSFVAKDSSGQSLVAALASLKSELVLSMMLFRDMLCDEDDLFAATNFAPPTADMYAKLLAVRKGQIHCDPCNKDMRGVVLRRTHQQRLGLSTLQLLVMCHAWSILRISAPSTERFGNQVFAAVCAEETPISSSSPLDKLLLHCVQHRAMVSSLRSTLPRATLVTALDNAKGVLVEQCQGASGNSTAPAEDVTVATALLPIVAEHSSAIGGTALFGRPPDVTSLSVIKAQHDLISLAPLTPETRAEARKAASGSLPTLAWLVGDAERSAVENFSGTTNFVEHMSLAAAASCCESDAQVLAASLMQRLKISRSVCGGVGQGSDERDESFASFLRNSFLRSTTRVLAHSLATSAFQVPTKMTRRPPQQQPVVVHNHGFLPLVGPLQATFADTLSDEGGLAAVETGLCSNVLLKTLAALVDELEQFTQDASTLQRLVSDEVVRIEQALRKAPVADQRYVDACVRDETAERTKLLHTILELQRNIASFAAPRRVKMNAIDDEGLVKGLRALSISSKDRSSDETLQTNASLATVGELQERARLLRRNISEISDKRAENDKVKAEALALRVQLIDALDTEKRVTATRVGGFRRQLQLRTDTRAATLQERLSTIRALQEEQTKALEEALIQAKDPLLEKTLTERRHHSRMESLKNEVARLEELKRKIVAEQQCNALSPIGKWDRLATGPQLSHRSKAVERSLMPIAWVSVSPADCEVSPVMRKTANDPKIPSPQSLQTRVGCWDDDQSSFDPRSWENVHVWVAAAE